MLHLEFTHQFVLSLQRWMVYKALSHVNLQCKLGFAYKIPPNLLPELNSESISRTNHRTLSVLLHSWNSWHIHFPPERLLSSAISFHAARLFLPGDNAPLIRIKPFFCPPCSEEFRWQDEIKWIHIRCMNNGSTLCAVSFHKLFHVEHRLWTMRPLWMFSLKSFNRNPELSEL